MKNTSKTALGAIITGLSVALMLSTAVLPFLSYAIPAICGVLIVLIVMECDKKWALIVYACVSILSLLIVPDKSAGLSYLCIFGYYPIVKAIFESKFPDWLSWIVKLLLADIVLIGSFYLSLKFFGIDTEGIEWISPYLTKWYVPFVIAIGGGVFFAMYDTVLTRLITLYEYKWRKRFRKYFK